MDLTQPAVLRPLRAGAHKVLAIPVLLLVVGLLTASPFLTILATLWTVAALTGVLLSRVTLAPEGVSVRPGLLGKAAAWPDVREIYVESSGLRRRSVVCRTEQTLVRLPSPPGYFRTDERLLALQLALVENWWQAHRGKAWRPPKRNRSTGQPGSARGGASSRGAGAGRSPSAPSGSRRPR